MLPLDGYAEAPVLRMEIDGRPKELGEVHRVRRRGRGGRRPSWSMGSIERFRFYEEARGCVAVFATLERRPYANMILLKGVLGPDGAVVRPERPARRPPAAASDPKLRYPPISGQGPGEGEHERQVASAAAVVVVTSAAISNASPPRRRARM